MPKVVSFSSLLSPGRAQLESIEKEKEKESKHRQKVLH